jgi:hypothetical protein
MKFFRGVSLAKGSQLRILFLLAGILLVTLAIQAFMIKEGFEEMGEAVVRQPSDPLVRQPNEALTRQPSDPLVRQPVRYLTEEQQEQLDKERIIFEQQRMFEQQQQNTIDLETLKKENELSISADERQDKAINAIKNATFKMIPERKRRSRLDDAASSYNA